MTSDKLLPDSAILAVYSSTNDAGWQTRDDKELDDLDIYYSFDNSYPDKFYPKYTAPLLVPNYATQIKVITYRNGKPIGRMISMPLSELRNRAEQKGDE